MLCTRTVGLASLLRGHANAATSLLEAHDERDAGLWYAEYALVPEAFLYLHRALRNTALTLEGLDVDTGAMFRRSGETFRETWGETAGAGFGVGVITVLVTLIGVGFAVGVLAVFGSTVVGAASGILLLVLVVFASFLLGTTLSGIAKVALYLYATEGVQPAQFDDVDFGTTVR